MEPFSLDSGFTEVPRRLNPDRTTLSSVVNRPERSVVSEGTLGFLGSVDSGIE